MIQRLISVLLGVLCLGVLGLWIRSYRTWDRIGFSVVELGLPSTQHDMSMEIQSVRGSLGVWRAVYVRVAKPHFDILGNRWPEELDKLRDVDRIELERYWRSGRVADGRLPNYDRPRDPVRVFEIYYGNWNTPRHWRGFARINSIQGSRQNEVFISRHGAAVPHWLLILLTAVAPALWLRRRLIAHHRRRRGRCLACGYDLRGITGGACPECGASIGAGGGASPSCR